LLLEKRNDGVLASPSNTTYSKLASILIGDCDTRDPYPLQINQHAPNCLLSYGSATSLNLKGDEDDRKSYSSRVTVIHTCKLSMTQMVQNKQSASTETDIQQVDYFSPDVIFPDYYLWSDSIIIGYFAYRIPRIIRNRPYITSNPHPNFPQLDFNTCQSPSDPALRVTTFRHA